VKDFAEPLTRLIHELGRLPGVGQRTAERLAYHLLNADTEDVLALAGAIRDIKTKLKPCRVCFNVTDGETCSICASPTRDQGRIAVVESVRDLVAIERSGAWNGVYHVLGGRVAPLEGRSLETSTFSKLLKRLEEDTEGRIREIVIATNPDAEGDTTALVLKEHLEGMGRKVTRLARGIPTGGSIEFANVDILKDAFEGRDPV